MRLGRNSVCHCEIGSPKVISQWMMLPLEGKSSDATQKMQHEPLKDQDSNTSLSVDSISHGGQVVRHNSENTVHSVCQ
jgi:hypothetical protein